MIRKLVLSLAFIFLFTSCGVKSSDNDISNAKISQEESVEQVIKEREKDDNEKSLKNDPYKDLYDKLNGMKFYIDPGTSYMESIYFYEDGYFDGSKATGNDAFMNVSLYNGKFDIVEKLDDDSYKLKLVRFDYEKEEGETEIRKNNDTYYSYTYEKTDTFKENLDDNEIILYLPSTKYSRFDQNDLSFFTIMGKNPEEDESLNNYWLDINGIFMSEYIK
ncbi:MAG: hypothetical protein Q4B36_04400 [Tissierellia bacterium]|nr:hypothetical protein [Tissierellia bacterium]